MPDDASNDSNSDYQPMPRYRSKAKARVLRESDAMRLGISGTLKEVSVMRISVLLDTEILIDEHIKIELTNDLQRFSKMVRGVVRDASSYGEDEYLLDIELLLRLTPLEVFLLKTNVPEEEDDAYESFWF